MSTWISERRTRRGALCAVLLLALPGCLAPGPQGRQAPLTEATLGPGPVRVSAPRGYCIDEGSLRRLAGGGGFALLAPCAQMTDTPRIAAAPALRTVSVMPQRPDTAPPDAEALAAAIAPAPVGARGHEAGLVYAQVMTGGEAVLPGGDARHWRGTRAVGGHLASLALYAPEDSPLAGREGRLLLGDLAAGLSAQPATADADAAPGASAQDQDEAEAPAPQRRGFFARLFPRSN